MRNGDRRIQSQSNREDFSPNHTYNTKKFIGFSLPTYTQVPDELFDILLPDLTEAELKVLLYIIRRTLGSKKEWEQITIKEIGEKCGKGKMSILRAIKSLKQKNYINVTEQRDDKGRNTANLYSLRKEPGG